MYPRDMGDFILPRRRLVSRLAANGVVSSRITDAMLRVPRHIFISEALRYRAYEDTSLPIGYGQTISRPSTVARMLQALHLLGDERVLEIGTGTGYQSALLAELSLAVVTMERIEELYKRARENLLIKLNYRNVVPVHAEDFTTVHGPFDAVIVSAGAAALPEGLFELLGEGGIMIVPVKNGSGYILRRYIRRAGGGIVEDNMGDAHFVPLVRNTGT